MLRSGWSVEQFGTHHSLQVGIILDEKTGRGMDRNCDVVTPDRSDEIAKNSIRFIGCNRSVFTTRVRQFLESGIVKAIFQEVKQGACPKRVTCRLFLFLSPF